MTSYLDRGEAGEGQQDCCCSLVVWVPDCPKGHQHDTGRGRLELLLHRGYCRVRVMQYALGQGRVARHISHNSLC